MQGEQRLTLLDEPPDRNATHVQVHRNMFVGLSIQGSAVQNRVAGWGVEEKYCTLQSISARQRSQSFPDRGPLDLVLFDWHASVSLLRRNTARWYMPGNVVTLPVFQEEWGGRNVGEAVDRKIPQEELPSVGVVPEQPRAAAVTNPVLRAAGRRCRGSGRSRDSLYPGHRGFSQKSERDSHEENQPVRIQFLKTRNEEANPRQETPLRGGPDANLMRAVCRTDFRVRPCRSVARQHRSARPIPSVDVCVSILYL